MNRRIAWLLAGLVSGAVLGGTALAGGYDLASNCTLAPLHFVFGGRPATPQVANGNPAGFICNGTTYVPVRFVSQALGQTVGWDGRTDTVTIGTGTAPGGAGAQGQSWTDQGITFTDAQVTLDPSKGWPTVHLTAANTTPSAHAFTFTVSFFDGNGKRLGIAQGAEMNLGAGQTRSELAWGITDVSGYTHIQVQVGEVLAPQP